MQKPFSKTVYVKAAAITLLVFGLGMAAGWWFDEQRLAVVSDRLEETKVLADEARLAMAYSNAFGSDPGFCSVFGLQLNALLERVSKFGSELARVEETNKLDESFNRYKSQYVMSSIELWLQVNNYKRACNRTLPLSVLYFYPDRRPCIDPQCIDSRLQAQALLSLKEKCPEKIWIFSLPVNSSVGVAKMLEKQYGISSTPSLVVNGEKVLPGMRDKGYLESRFPALAGCG